MKQGMVRQRHLTACGRNGRCGCPWAYQVDLGRDESDKRRYASRSGFGTKSAAREALRQACERLRDGDPAAYGMTTGTYLHQWIDAREQAGNLRPTTLASYRDHVERYFVPLLGRVPLVELRAGHLDRMNTTIREGNAGRRRPVGPASVRRIHATLSAALGAAVKRRLIPYNPCAHVELPAAKRAPVEVWSAETVAAFLAHVREDRLGALWRVLVLRGLRRGEVLGLRWADIDLDHGRLRVAQQLVSVQGRVIFGPPKTARGRRTVPLDDGTMTELREHRKRQVAEQLEWGVAYEDHGLAFCHENGQPLDPAYLTRRFATIVRLAGLPALRLHGLRHTAASLALSAGADMKVVSEQLGHAGIAITLDTYTHVAPKVAADAADRVAALIRNSKAQ